MRPEPGRKLFGSHCWTNWNAHFATKTVSSPQWIWATFEHVDNLEVNPLATYNGKNLEAIFLRSGMPNLPDQCIP